jgi:ubiquinone/menaquinone biosynthesis C-methylase UbiE
MTFEKISEWHNRYKRQAQWTMDLRTYLFKQIKLSPGNRVLEVGCGTGVILKELEEFGTIPVGLDIDTHHIKIAMRNISTSHLSAGDAHHLPFRDNYFDFTFCHFLLLWVENPIRVISEMARVTKPGGCVLSLAEPDYGGRIDYPEELEILGEHQVKSLFLQGADPYLGRKLAYYFSRAGLDSVHTGVLGGQWSNNPDWDSWNSEWQVLESDIAQNPNLINTNQISQAKEKDRAAFEAGVRVLFVPTFYARGIVLNLQTHD